MEIYTLDPLYRPVEVIDRFESMIWTERYQAMGDFELSMVSTPASRRLLTTGTRLAINESYLVMEIETLENKRTSGESMLNIKGRSLEKILDDRAPTTYTMVGDPNSQQQKLVFTGVPAEIARKVFRDINILGLQDVGDILPGVFEGNGGLYPEDTIPEPTEVVTLEMEPTTLYEVTKSICELYDLGFRLVRNPATWQLYYDIYTGSDRTSSQNDLDPVIFSPDLDNLQDTTELTTTVLSKNIAYVLSPVGHEIVFAQDVVNAVSGFDRRVLLVKADDITDTDPAVASAKMIQRGKEELAKNRSFSAFDGELSQTSRYMPGRDYNLGDLVEQRNDDGVTNYMKVTEQIFVQDKEGQRSYPTLSINKFIQPGTWLAWDYNQTWADLASSPETWADQP
jgi:hypothetical protein